MPTETIFQKILKHEVPSEVVYEDDGALAFMDIVPNARGHVLVIPKGETGENLTDTDETAMAPVWRAVHHIAPRIIEAVEAAGFNVIMNNGHAAGQRVFSPHVHIVPRFDGDGLEPWPKIERSVEEIAADAVIIRAALKE